MITYENGDVESQIDYLLMKEKTFTVLKYKMILGEECMTQHRLLCVDMVVDN